MVGAVIPAPPTDNPPEALRLTEVSAPVEPPDKAPSVILPPVPLLLTLIAALVAVRLPALMAPS